MRKTYYLLICFLLLIVGIGYSGNAEGQTIITVAGGTGTTYCEGCHATAAQLKFPTCVAVDASGNMYIADYNNQTIRYVNATTTNIYTIAGIPGTSGTGADNIAATLSALNQPNGVAFDAAGNFYIAEQGGNVVRKVNTAGIITTIAGDTHGAFTGDGVATTHELYQPTNIAVDAAGDVYIADWNNNRVRVVTPAGNMYTVAGGGSATGYGGPATAAKLQSPYSVSLDAFGNLYISDENDQRLVKVNLATDIIYAVGGSYGTSGYTGDGGPATAGLFQYPDGIVADATSLYICDYGNNRIQQVNIATDIDSTAVGIASRVAGFSGDGGPATAAQLNGPAGVAIDVYGNIYIADFNNNRIRKVGSGNHAPAFVNGETQSFNVCENSVGDSLNDLLKVNDIDVGNTETWSLRLAPTHGYAFVSYVTTSTGSTLRPTGLFYTPTYGYSGPDSFKVMVNDGISVDTTMIYVNIKSFYAGHITPQPAIVCPGNSITLSADTSGGTWSSANTSIATVAGGVVTGGSTAGNVAISYTITNSCGSATSMAEVTVGVPIIVTFAGTGTTSYTGDGGQATNATLNNTHGLSVDPTTGYIYIIDDFNSVIRKVDPSTGIITSVAGTGVTGYSGDGIATAVKLNHPFEVLADGLGNVYVTDASNNMIRKINSSGNIVTIAGTGTAGSTGDGGFAATATLNVPSGLAMDAAGNLYFSDLHKVRKIDPSGIITTFAGTGTLGFGGDNGPATAALFSHCNYLHMDPQGNLIIVDNGNHKIRKVNLSTNIITAVVGTGATGNSGDGGQATAATLDFPGGVAFDAAGNMYIATDAGESIRMVNALGIITTVVGPTGTVGAFGYTGDGGPPTAATLHTPVDVAFDANGNMFIADQQNSVVREVIVTDPLVAAISGSATVCQGATTNWTDATLGGTWSSGNTVVASVGSSGIVTGNSIGTAMITYSVLFPCGTLYATHVISVTPPPDPITGNPAICLGSTSQLNDDISGGIWSSSNSSVAIIGTTGLVLGASLGTAIITYSLSAGCNAYLTVTVNPVPAAILPSSPVSICTGNFFDLSDASGSGNWSSSAITVASVTPTIGAFTAVYGVGAGTAIITYTNSFGCYVTKSVTVVQTPAPISPSSAFVCQFKTVTLTEGTFGGLWSSSNTSIASVSGGIVTGVNSGSAIITYAIGSCISTATVTVGAAPTSITGTLTICAGSTTNLTGNPGGGTWVSGTTGVATINSGGVATGVSAGSSIITYTLSSGCYITTTLIVTTAPGAIGGTKSVCVGLVTNLNDFPGSGTWTSSSSSIASVNSGSGAVTGVSQGTAIITYSLGSGCIAVTTVTVNPNPGPISGTNNICVGATTFLTEGSSGGVWATSNAAIASVLTGTVTGVSAGTAIISYSFGTGCNSTFGFTVNPAPGPITGTTHVCVGFTTLLSDGIPGGGWTSSNGSVATVVGGTVTGIGQGTASITYTLGTSCLTSTLVTVNPNPTGISGVTTVCSGGTSSLTDLPGGGNWTSSNTGVATINAITGFVTAVGSGTSIISYTLGTGCYNTAVFTVNTGPSGIFGITSVCVGATTQLSDLVGGGAWTSANTGVATVGSNTGTVMGVTAGTVIISYNLGAGCIATTTVAVNANPNPITPPGAVNVCPGQTTTLGDVSAGNWSSSNGSVATVGVSTGIVTGVSAGTVTISYTNAFGCYAVKSVTVNPAPNAILPASPTVCVGASTALTDGVGGGTWISNNLGIATVGSNSGTVMGVGTGTVIITYTIGACFTTTTVSVSGLLSAGAIVGPSVMCSTTPVTLTDGAGSGVWTSGNTTVATVGTGTGIVTGISAGTVIITFSVSNSCGTTYVTHSINVSVPGAGAIVGSPSVCAGTFFTYTDAVTGGAWTMANGAATITGGGLVTGITPGTDIITYTVNNACGISNTTKSITIGAFLTAGSITGSNTVCVGASTPMVDLAPGGVWSTSNAYATISIGGSVTGVAAGVDTISYSVTSACGSAYAIHQVTVNPLPIAGSIVGPVSICTGSPTSYTDATGGGVWSVRNVSAAITGSGVVTGVLTGTNIISYSVSNTCGTAVATETINIGATLTAGVIAGPTSVCAGSNIVLTDGTPGGVWSSGNSSASVSGGTVSGVSAGVDTISYTVAASCGTVSATYTVSVIPIPNAGSITGPSNVCLGTPTTFTDPAIGGAWSMNNATATISGAGLVTPVSVGTNIVSYTISNSCGTSVATQNITIGTSPSAGTISGPGFVCIGTPITLIDPVIGGIWSASNADATVSGGVVSGVSAGLVTISYTVATACGTAVATQLVTVNLPSSAGSIVGPGALCLGSFTTYIDAAPGGTWSIANSTATITSGGMVTPVSAGTNIISYTVSGACGTAVATKTITVSTSSSAGTISGPSGVCIGSGVTLTDPVTGGTWSSSNAGVATVNSSGLVSGVSVGTTAISYTVTNGCGTSTATATIASSIAPNAGTIVGPSNICAGAYTIYTDAAPGGVWSVTNGNGTMAGGGVFTGVVPFSVDTVVYTVTNGCGTAVATQSVTIGTLLSAGSISGPGGLCGGSSVTLSDGLGGGIWYSSNPSVAIVGSNTGIVTGVSPGTTTISYSVSIACGTVFASMPFVVSGFPTAGTISGPSGVCNGGVMTLTGSIPGGGWSASNSNASISGLGVVTGLALGLDTITYTVTNYCGMASTTKTVAIQTFPDAGSISGPGAVCPGATVTLADGAAGGLWSSSNANATVGSITGIVTGVSAGFDNIIYSVTNACGTATTSMPITVNPAPDAGTITGPDTVCMTSSAFLSDAVSGGTWSAGNSNALISSFGIVTGISSGTDPISYTVTNSCGTAVAVRVESIDPTPAPGVISGSPLVCVGSGITLTETVSGGSWLASNATASIVGPGIIDGVTVGIDTIFYAVTNSCGTTTTSKILNVDPVPVVAPLSGPTTQCPGTSITLTDAVTGGVWTSSNTSVASIGVSTGIVTGVATGTAMITYTVTNSFGCPTSVTSLDTVISAPVIPAIAGSYNVCVGSTLTLTDADAGGTWNSSNPSVATINASTGLVSGMAAGTVTVSYTVVNVCGSSTITRIEAVNLLPVVSAITGVMHECAGSTSVMMDATSGGIWSSSSSAVATVGSSSGIVTGVTPGSATIMYTYTNIYGCSSTVVANDTVVAIPVAGAITGTTNECIGATTTLSDITTGGTWASSNISVATIDISSGLVTGIAAGVVTIDYTVTNIAGCSAVATAHDTVNATPVESAIGGTMNACAGATTTLSNIVPFGVWSSANLSVATINAATGVVTGVSAGADKIYYTVSNSCGSALDSAMVTIYALPNAGSISAAYTTLCSGTTVHLTDAASGGAWGSGNPAIATVSSSGVVTGVTSGTVIVSYKVTNTSGCTSTASIVLNIAGAMPSASVSPAGSVTLCHGNSITLHVTSGAGITYQWMRNGSPIAGATNASYTTTTAGVYSVAISNGACSETITGTTVNPPPTPVITYNPPNELMTGSFSSYQWFLNGIAIPGANSSTYYYIVGGNYTVEVTDAGGCSDVSIPYAVSGSGVSGVNVVINTDDVKIYPNPASSILNIDAPATVNAAILSIDGKTLIEVRNAKTIDISHLAVGMYMVQVYDENDVLIKTAKVAKVQ